MDTDLKQQELKEFITNGWLTRRTTCPKIKNNITSTEEISHIRIG